MEQNIRMNNRMISQEYKELRRSLYYHLLIFGITSVLNIIFMIKIYFIFKVYKAFFYIGSIIFIFIFLIPIYPIVLLCKKLLLSDKVKKMIKLSFIIFLFVLFLGIIINLVIFLNIFELFTFNKECPYNFSYNDFSKFFNLNYITKDIDYNQLSKCSDNRCILIKNNLNNTSENLYLCNFDSSNDFQNFKNRISNKASDTVKNNLIKCELFRKKEFEDENNFNENSEEEYFIIKSFYDICSSENNFFKCYRYKNPKKYKIDYDFSCPNILTSIIDIIFGIISVTFNLIFPLIISVIQYLKYKNILKLYQNINDERTSTRNSSKIEEESKKSEINNIENNNNEMIIIETNYNKSNELKQNTDKNMINDEDVLNINKKDRNDFKETEEIISERKNINIMITEDIKDDLNNNEKENKDKKNNDKNIYDIKSDDKKNNNSIFFEKVNLTKKKKFDDI